VPDDGDTRLDLPPGPPSPDAPARDGLGPAAGADAGRPHRNRWGAISGSVVLVYLVVWGLGLSRIANRTTFNRWGAAMGSLGARVVICGVVLATLFHTFDGFRRLLADAVPRSRAHEVQLRAWVLFATWAIALPCFAAIIWPWVAETTR
jgi:succinate dehydrogenase hydrophobic anchor subunit